ncbi:hypothetical protein [Paenibacillus alvei]|uniref:Uncharacterized protein n=1 Tax=Paenibacillus alvei TaxID=44250 RepID=A0AAP7DLV7_PAEAL|nr:hypothetical protein [Paenibacillus alvei]NOJ74166.1 hypothetical protein [Paenibacillus alvei]
MKISLERKVDYFKLEENDIETGEGLVTVFLQGQNNEQPLNQIILNAVLLLLRSIDFDEASTEQHGAEKIILPILNSLGVSIEFAQLWLTLQDDDFRYLSVVEEYIKEIKQKEHPEAAELINILQSDEY